MRWRAFFLALALALGALVGLGVAWAGNNLRTALLIAIIVVVPLPLVVRLVQRKLDPFEPVQFFSLIVAVLFVARPLAELHYGMTNYAGFFTRPGFNGALAIALVGICAFYIGYFSPAGAWLSRRIPPLPERWDTERSVAFAARMLVVAALALALFAATVGGPGVLLDLYSGRVGPENAALLSSSSGWIYLLPYLTIPASLILLVARSERPTPATTALLVVSVTSALILTVPRGDRGYIVALLLPLLAVPFLRRDRRPRLLTIGVGMVIAVLAINVLAAVRYKEKRADPVDALVTAVSSPTTQMETFITGPDPSLFSVLSLEYAVVPNYVPFDPGKTPVSMVAGPVPGRLWQGKPQPPTKNVTDYLFAEQAQFARATNLPSLLGDAYADYGFVTVALELMLLGVVFRTVYLIFVRQKRNPAMQIAFAASLPPVFDLMRNTLTDTTGRSLILVAPIILCVWVCSRPRGAVLPRMRRGVLAAAFSSRR